MPCVPCSILFSWSRPGSPVSSVTAGMPASTAARRSVPASPSLCSTDVAAEARRELAATAGRLHVGAQLRQVRALERARVDVDQRVRSWRTTFSKNECAMRDAELPLRGAREEAVQVAAVGQVARAAPEPVQVDDRHADHGARRACCGLERRRARGARSRSRSARRRAAPRSGTASGPRAAPFTTSTAVGTAMPSKLWSGDHARRTRCASSVPPSSDAVRGGRISVERLRRGRRAPQTDRSGTPRLRRRRLAPARLSHGRASFGARDRGARDPRADQAHARAR